MASKQAYLYLVSAFFGNVLLDQTCTIDHPWLGQVNCTASINFFNLSNLILGSSSGLVPSNSNFVFFTWRTSKTAYLSFHVCVLDQTCTTDPMTQFGLVWLVLTYVRTVDGFCASFKHRGICFISHLRFATLFLFFSLNSQYSICFILNLTTTDLIASL